MPRGADAEVRRRAGGDARDDEARPRSDHDGRPGDGWPGRRPESVTGSQSRGTHALGGCRAGGGEWPGRRMGITEGRAEGAPPTRVFHRPPPPPITGPASTGKDRRGSEAPVPTPVTPSRSSRATRRGPRTAPASRGSSERIESPPTSPAPRRGCGRSPRPPTRSGTRRGGHASRSDNLPAGAGGARRSPGPRAIPSSG